MMAYVDLVAKPAGEFQTIKYLGDTLPCAEAVSPDVAAAIYSGIWYWNGADWVGWSPTAPDWANDLKILEYGKTYEINVSTAIRWTFIGGQKRSPWLWVGVGTVGFLALAAASEGSRPRGGRR